MMIFVLPILIGDVTVSRGERRHGGLSIDPRHYLGHFLIPAWRARTVSAPCGQAWRDTSIRGLRGRGHFTLADCQPTHSGIPHSERLLSATMAGVVA